MKFGLHFALAEAAPDSPVLRQNPDWTSSTTYGYFGAVSICLSHKPVRDWLIAETVRMIDEYNLDWILQDGENMVKNCTKPSHSHHPANSNWDNAVNGINAVVTGVQQQRPNTHWENCEDGGNMMTFNMVKNYVTSITCDDSGPLTSRQAMWGATYVFPPRYTDRYMPDEQLNSYVTRSFMFGGPWIFMNRLPNLSRQSLEYAASEIRIYKAMRKSIRNGKVFHLTLRPEDTRTDAIQSLDPATGSAIMIATRAGSAAAPNPIRLRGLEPARSYRVRFADSPYTFSMTGLQLMTTGVRVNLPSMWSAEIVYVDPEQVQ
jgi:alpha-galactosidase